MTRMARGLISFSPMKLRLICAFASDFTQGNDSKLIYRVL